MSEGRPESAAEDRTFRPAPTLPDPAFLSDPAPSGRHPVAPLGPALVHASMPFTGPFGPLIGFLVLRTKPGPDRESVVEALNFSLCYSVAMIVSAILTTVLIGAVMLPLVMLAALVLGIAGAIETHRGRPYRYPVNLRLVR